jgi:serine/threonine protein kinase
MTESTPTENPRLLSVAAAIARGEAVDWASLPSDDDPETTTVLNELRSIESLSRVGHPIPDAWGQFAITGELGHGSYGTVYRAVDPNLGLDVALKIIRRDSAGSDAGATAALNEARLLAQITHPNVVRIYSAERIGNEVGIAMELIHGQTLHHLVRNHGPFSANETMLIASDLSRAAAAVHAAQLLHGDIKANNVMRAQGGRTVLMDFGAGNDLKAHPAPHRRTVGTPLYLAPEVLAGGPPTRASDIYSIGVLMFYLATGSYPVPGHARSDVELAHAQQAPRRLLRDIRPDLTEPFIHIVERATAHRPADRYATAGELEAALVRALRNEDLTPLNRPWQKWWPIPIAAALVVALTGLGYQLWTDRSAVSGGAPAAAVVTTPAPAPTAAAAADAYQVEAAFYRQQSGSPVRLQPGARIAKGDKLSLQIRSSVPTYVYVINEDDRGESYLLFPLPGQQLTNPLPPGTLHEIPGVVNGERINWEVSSIGGREHFLVFVSPNPPVPAFDRLFASLPRPTLGAPPVAQPLSGDLVTALRGVGGLAKAPARPAGERLSTEYAVPLPDGEETARGVWIRQLTLENPEK